MSKQSAVNVGRKCGLGSHHVTGQERKGMVTGKAFSRAVVLNLPNARPFNIVPQIVETPNHKSIFLL